MDLRNAMTSLIRTYSEAHMGSMCMHLRVPVYVAALTGLCLFLLCYRFTTFRNQTPNSKSIVSDSLPLPPSPKRFSPHSSGQPQTCFLAECDLELLILQPPLRSNVLTGMSIKGTLFVPNTELCFYKQ